MLFSAALISHKQSTSPINSTKFTSFFRLVRITAVVYCVVSNFHKSVKKSFQYRTPLPPCLTASHFTRAKTKQLHFSRTQNFLPVVFKSAKPLPTNSCIKTVTLYNCPNELLRAHGGLEKSQLDLETKLPIMSDVKQPISFSHHFARNNTVVYNTSALFSSKPFVEPPLLPPFAAS